MEMELVLRRNNQNGTLCFFIPKVFTNEDYSHAFVSPKLIAGNKYKVTIEEVK
jgi:hypothetical protein